MQVEQLLADSIAHDLGAPPDDLRATILAASASAALVALGERIRPESGEAIPYDQAMRSSSRCSISSAADWTTFS